MSVLLHVGDYKTGSTSIQLWLRDHPDLLAKYGARFPRGWLRRDNHLELALMLMDDDRLSPARTRGDEWRDPEWRVGLAAQVDDDLLRHHREVTVLSAEDTGLLRSEDELSGLESFVGDAHIVIYLRDRSDWLAAWEDTLVHKLGLPTSASPGAYNCVTRSSRFLDYGDRLDRWREHFTQVTVFNYDRLVARDGSVIPAFAALLGIERAEVGDLAPYWLNGRATSYNHREPGLRWTHDLPFGAEP